MSATFSAEIGPIKGFTLKCVHGATKHHFDTFIKAQTFLQAEKDEHGGTGHLAECGDEFCEAMLMSIEAVEEDPSPAVRVSYHNARHLLDLLGYGHETSVVGGSDTAENFLGRVLVALAVNPADAGVPATSSKNAGSPEMIHCGRREGYSEDHLEALREVANFAASRGRAVQWC
ncbi:hypothetical protein [Pseudarthrobacter sp. BIM B-2242]|uniref:hypothetical protein n=1 Tax=Pseudarthrobacter sp. BIM B-2242 TaxID=2772401 RepID=UPI00168B8618|nr:hypothetical protein [Pseudarthrobacter sp. BIM B-2242]QOD05789.1 hypothetical protein IDT60_22400 [Pseudarthrobacter sp. BIM B-2242]